VLCDRPERHAWRSRSSPKVPPTSAPAASAGALARFGAPRLHSANAWVTLSRRGKRNARPEPEEAPT
jgi:hypothetical protein